MFSEWFYRYSVLGDRQAGEKIVWYGYLFPQMMKELSRYLKLDMVNVPIVDWNRPYPDPSPERLNTFHESVLGQRELGKVLMGDPSPQPSLQSPRLRLEAAKALRENITGLIGDLNEDIYRMQKMSEKLTTAK